MDTWENEGGATLPYEDARWSQWMIRQILAALAARGMGSTVFNGTRIKS